MSLLNKTIYLAGGIAGLSDAQCNHWRTLVKNNWPGKTLDPMRRDGRGRERQPGAVQEIVEGDKLDILQCDGVLVWYEKPSVGTSMEILFAWTQHKPLALINASGKPEHELSYWIRYHCAGYIFEGQVEALESLERRLVGKDAPVVTSAYDKGLEELNESSYWARFPDLPAA